jgi:hypothetical protein
MTTSNFGPPIPTPDGRVAPQPVPVYDRTNFKTAPQIVKTCGGSIAIFNILLGLVLTPMGLIPDLDPMIRVALFGGGLAWLTLNIWHIIGLRKGNPTAWIVQIILSVLGIFYFPFGIIIHTYILIYWFKPEIKAWFGKA